MSKGRFDLEETLFEGCHYSNAGPTPPHRCMLAQNMYTQGDGAWHSRPGWNLRGEGSLTDTEEAQCIGAFWVSGVPVYFAIVDGEIWGSASMDSGWTKRVTSANLSAAPGGSINVGTNSTLFWTPFMDTVVITGGSDVFTWDGTTGAAGLTLLSNAPTFVYGKAAVYYGKLFFIVGDGSPVIPSYSIAWSEEFQPNVGYEAGGYNNAWDLKQTSQVPIYSLVATNEALYYFRSIGIGRITGRVTTDFQTTGVHDTVSTSHGCAAPEGAIYLDGDIWFVDDARPKVLIDGEVVVDLSPQMWGVTENSWPGWFTNRNITEDIIGARWEQLTMRPVICYEANTNCVLVWNDTNASGPRELTTPMVYRADNYAFQGFWQSLSTIKVTAVGAAHYSTSGILTPILMLGLDDGQAGYGWINPVRAGVWGNDDIDGTLRTVPRRIIGPRQRWKTGRAFTVRKVTAELAVPQKSDLLEVDVQLITPNYSVGDTVPPGNNQAVTINCGDGRLATNVGPRIIQVDVEPDRGRWFQLDMLFEMQNSGGTPYATTKSTSGALWGWTLHCEELGDIDPAEA